ncbi:MAG: response regulator transcription factor [Chlorobi bacterium]|nr:response regulator transcription factor [Chlorobiota bacterium]
MDKFSENKILVVDDDPHVINRIVDILSDETSKYIFYQANDGNIAFKIAENKLPDLIITDWDMPFVNGIELIKKIKDNSVTKEIPIIMATAVMQSSKDLKMALEAGAADYIRKPIDEIELIARVQSVIKISEYNKKIIDNKNREIAENALMLIRNNKFNIQLIKKLKELHDKLSEKDDETENLFEFIINSINEKVKQDSWQKFELILKSSNDNFSEKLIERFPNLTISEIKLSSFLKLGMNTKEIASVLFQSMDSIKVARSRLRKKLNLSSDRNLSVFLSSL